MNLAETTSVETWWAINYFKPHRVEITYNPPLMIVRGIGIACHELGNGTAEERGYFRTERECWQGVIDLRRKAVAEFTATHEAAIAEIEKRIANL